MASFCPSQGLWRGTRVLCKWHNTANLTTGICCRISFYIWTCDIYVFLLNLSAIVYFVFFYWGKCYLLLRTNSISLSYCWLVTIEFWWQRLSLIVLKTLGFLFLNSVVVIMLVWIWILVYITMEIVKSSWVCCGGERGF